LLSISILLSVPHPSLRQEIDVAHSQLHPMAIRELRAIRVRRREAHWQALAQEKVKELETEVDREVQIAAFPQAST
jgi:hypothetical protein